MQSTARDTLGSLSKMLDHACLREYVSEQKMNEGSQGIQPQGLEGIDGAQVLCPSSRSQVGRGHSILQADEFRWERLRLRDWAGLVDKHSFAHSIRGLLLPLSLAKLYLELRRSGSQSLFACCYPRQKEAGSSRGENAVAASFIGDAHLHASQEESGSNRHGQCQGVVVSFG